MNLLWFKKNFQGVRKRRREEVTNRIFRGRNPRDISIVVIMAKRIHLFPSRTQKLSSLAPKVLSGWLLGRIGHRHISLSSVAFATEFFFTQNNLPLWAFSFVQQTVERCSSLRSFSFVVNFAIFAGMERFSDAEFTSWKTFEKASPKMLTYCLS